MQSRTLKQWPENDDAVSGCDPEVRGSGCDPELPGSGCHPEVPGSGCDPEVRGLD